MKEPWYCTREDVATALDVKMTARRDAQIDQAVETASRDIDRAMHRKFYPWTGTRYFDWPNRTYSRSYRLWLNQHELYSASSVTSGGDAIAASDYFLRPDDGPPYNRLELDLDGSASFGQGGTHQRDIAIAGVWAGASVDTTPAGALAEALDSSETEVDVTNSALVGVGDLLLVDSERMIVTGRSMLDTGRDIEVAGDMTAQANSVTLVATNASDIFVDETLLVDSERMLVIDKAANTLTVKRAVDGSVLAAHAAGASIYAARTLTVERGSVGTTAAAHSAAAAVARHLWPGPIRALAKAIAINQLEQELSAYARTVGSGENQREASGKGLRAAWDNADLYRRRARSGAI